MKIFTLSMLFLLSFLSLSCTKDIDTEADKAEILNMLAADDQDLLNGISKDD
jgi:hypothetical protein